LDIAKDVKRLVALLSDAFPRNLLDAALWHYEAQLPIAYIHLPRIALAHHALMADNQFRASSQ
jgi:hypothetical protein